MGRGRRFRLNWATVLVRLSTGALALAVVLFAVFGLLLSFRDGCGKSTLMEDLNKLRTLVSLTFPDGIPVRDGAFDPYEFVRRGEIEGVNLNLFRSERSGSGPTDEEIRRGDYTRFPWERYRGDGERRQATFLLLWEKTPDKHGGRLVALSDGSARYCEREDFAGLVGR